MKKNAELKEVAEFRKMQRENKARSALKSLFEGPDYVTEREVCSLVNGIAVFDYELALLIFAEGKILLDRQ